MGDISLDTTQQQEPISLDTNPSQPKLPQTVSSARASKATFGLSQINQKSYQDTHQEISTGQEPQFRQEAASAVDADNLKKYLIGQASIDKLTGHRTDPRSVLENYYSGEYLKPMYDVSDQFTGGSFMRDAQAEIPEHVADAAARGSQMITKREALLTRAENLEAAAQQRGWRGTAMEFIAGSVPFYSQMLQRLQVPTTEFHVLPGENIADQSRTAYRMPMDEFNNTLDQIEATYGKQYPGQAAQYLRQLAGMATDERIMNDQLGLIDISAIAGPITGILGRRIGLFNHARKATQDAVRSSEHVGGIQEPELSPEIADWENEGGAVGREPVAVRAAAGRGDLETAAVQKAATNLVEDTTGKSNSQRRSLEALTSEHRVDLAILRDEKERGIVGQDLANRIEEAYTRHDIDVAGALETAMRSNRTPVVETAPDVVRAIEQKIKEGDHSILDVKTHLDPITNTYWHEIPIGTAEGKLFPKREEAEGSAEYRGLTQSTGGTKPARKIELNRLIAEAQDRLALEATAAEATMEGEGGRAFPREQIEKNIATWTKELNEPAIEGYTIEQQGNGYYIAYNRPMNAYERAVDGDGKELGFHRPITGPTKTNVPSDPSLWTRATKWLTTSRQSKLAREETPYLNETGLINELRTILGWVRTPEETLAYELSTQRGIAAHAANVLRPLYKRISLPRKYVDDFNRILKLGQELPDPDNGNIPGYTFKGVQELNNAYLTHIGRLPSDAETEQYFVYKRNGDLDLALRRIQLFIPKADRGAEQHQFSVIGPDGSKVKSGFFEGIRRDGIPTGDDNIVVIGTHAGQEQVYKANDIKFIKVRKDLDPKVRDGTAGVIEILNPDTKPLRNYGGVGDARVRYAIVQSYEVKPLSLQGQLPRRGGGHLQPDYEWASKQAKVERDNVGSSPRDIYTGDTTAMVFSDRKTAQQIVDKKNRVREILNRDPKKFGKYTKDTLAAAKEAFRKEKLPMPWHEFFQEFQETRDPQGNKVPPRFSTKEPFTLVNMRKNETIAGLNKDLETRYGKQWVDGTKAGSIARTINVEFSGERDAHELMTIADKGGRNNPVYSYERAKLLDPIAAQNRGLARIINSTWMNDVKVYSLNKWLRDAERYLTASSSEIWHSPYYHFNEIDKTKFKPGTPASVKRILLQNHRAIQAFLGTPSIIDNVLHTMSQHMADTIHGAVGPKLVPRAMLSRIKDPIPFIRSMTYSLDMGLGSVKQFFTQFTTHSNIFGIEPKHAPAGAMATMLHGWAHFNASPEILNALDEMATKLRMPGMSHFKPGQWREAYEFAQSTGFTKIGDEHALAADYPASARMVKSAGGQILDWGLAPFKLGAESVRSTALYTAYLKFRETAPTGRLTRANKADILSHARLLDHNMSREANSVLHTGIASLPGQFFAYDMRLAEIMTGKRISPLQKARLFATSAMLYGVPVGGLGLFGYPIASAIRKKMTEDYGYHPGNNLLQSFLMEGFPALIMASITSHQGINPKYGNWYNFSKFGSKGIDYLEEILYSDVTMWKILSGASGSILSNTVQNTSSLRAALMPHLLGGVDGYKFSYEDALDALKVIASYDEAWKIKSAIHTGTWLSNNGTAIGDKVSVSDAIFMGLTGLTHTEYSDTYVKEQLMKDQESFEKGIFKMAKENFTKYLQAMKDNDPEQAKFYKTRAFAILDIAGGYPPQKKAQAIAAMAKGNESMMKQIDREYYTRSQTKQKLDEYKDLLRQEQGKGQ